MKKFITKTFLFSKTDLSAKPQNFQRSKSSDTVTSV